MPRVTLTPTVLSNDASIVYGGGADELAWILGSNDARIESFDQLEDYSQYLFLTGLNAAIPTGSTIDGVVFEEDRTSGVSGFPVIAAVRDLEVRMVIAGAVAGDNKAKSTDWANFGEAVSYGGAADKWGNTPTAAQVNASNFGIAVACRVSGWSAGNTLTPTVSDFAVTIYYTPPATGQAQVTFTASVSPATASAQKDVTFTAAVSRDIAEDVSFAAAVGPFLVLTEPDSGDTITSAELLATWETGPAVQSDYRIRVYSDALETELVFDSGIVGSTQTQHLFTAGQLPAGALWMRVVNHDVNQMEGRSALVDFTTSFPTSVDITGVAAEAIGGLCDAQLLPGVKVSWNQITPGGGETFVRYEVRRRKPGETAYTTIAFITDIATTEYKDYAVTPAQVYEYAIVWIATSGASTLISAVQTSPARQRVAFDFSYLHSIADPTIFVRLAHWEALVELMQPVDVFEPWGREAGTAYTGEQFSHQITIPLHNERRKVGAVWAGLLALARQQRTGDMLCLRMGRDRERYFCVMRRPRKQVSQKTYEPSIELVEVGFDEAVTE